ncbi:MAG: hypothetical protein ABIJ56_06650, partial [Pseudomonadota bacterium]
MQKDTTLKPLILVVAVVLAFHSAGCGCDEENLAGDTAQDDDTAPDLAEAIDALPDDTPEI